MLSEQFLTRVQVSKLMGFRSDGMIKDFEKRGFLKPDIKPSKYSLIQVFFLFFCKELVDHTSFTWKILISENFNEISQQELYKKYSVYFFIPDNVIFERIGDNDNTNLNPDIIKIGNITLAMFDNDVFNNQFEQSYELINNFLKRNDINTVLKIPVNGNDTIAVSLMRLKLKFSKKCQELNIDLTEKLFL